MLGIMHHSCLDFDSGAVSATGPDAPLVLDRKVMATHSEHAHDFYKPAGQFFPVVRARNPAVASNQSTLMGTICGRLCLSRGQGPFALALSGALQNEELEPADSSAVQAAPPSWRMVQTLAHALAQWDGRESVDSYLRTLRGCYGTLCDRFEASAAAAGRSGKAARFSIDRCCCTPVSDDPAASGGAICRHVMVTAAAG